jgi:hypothetical protein
MKRTAALLILAAAGCGIRTIDLGGPVVGTGNDAGSPNPGNDAGSPNPGPQPVTIPLAPPAPNGMLNAKVDVLFMVDNSNSMNAMQSELQKRFPQFLQVFSDLAAAGVLTDLQIGVVTSDYGAGATGAPGCQPSPGGQRGMLQAIGAAAQAGCLKPVGANFIQYAFAAGGAQGANNLPPGQSLADTFTCMASVGSNGCGFEHQLESVYAALHNGLPENQGFIRNDALLVIVFVTNEDDSSAPPTTDMFETSLAAIYGFEDSYRQTRFGVECCPPGMASCAANQLQLTPYADSMGPLTQCQPAPNPNGIGPGKEYDVSRYIDFFTLPAAQGGIKDDPNRVVLVALDAPDNPVQIILSNPGTAGGQAYIECPQLDEASNPPCVPVLQHSCQNPAEPVFFGDPAVRLNTVVNAAPNHLLASICESDYSVPLQNVASAVASHIGIGCLPYALGGAAAPDCTVEMRTENVDGTTTVVQVPACAAGGSRPCWQAATNAAGACSGSSPDNLQLTVVFGAPAPPNTSITATCVPPA